VSRFVDFGRASFSISNPHPHIAKNLVIHKPFIES
jgi:hypothetical protein